MMITSAIDIISEAKLNQSDLFLLKTSIYLQFGWITEKYKHTSTGYNIHFVHKVKIFDRLKKKWRIV